MYSCLWENCNFGIFFFNSHLGYSVNFTVACHRQVVGGIPPPSGDIVGENRSTRSKTTIRSKRDIKSKSFLNLAILFVEDLSKLLNKFKNIYINNSVYLNGWFLFKKSYKQMHTSFQKVISCFAFSLNSNLF